MGKIGPPAVGRKSTEERRDCVAGESSFEDQGRSKVIGKNRDVLKVYAERSNGVFVGAEMFGPPPGISASRKLRLHP